MKIEKGQRIKDCAKVKKTLYLCGMNKNIASLIAGLAFVASGIMYVVGSGSSHLSELADLFWIPIPLGIAALIVALKKNS